jgi:hypothetical protein
MCAIPFQMATQSVTKKHGLLGLGMEVSMRAARKVATTVDEIWKPLQKQLSGAQFKRLSPVEKHLYEERRRIRKRRMDIVCNAQKSFESGKFIGVLVGGTVAQRLDGAGPPVKHPEVEEALYNYFLHQYLELRGRVTASLLRARANALFQKIQADAIEAGQPDPLPQNWESTWLSGWMAAWRNRFELCFRCKNQTYTLGYKEFRRRLGMLWRNCCRLTCFFHPNVLQWDAFDHTPVTRRLCAGKCMATKGAEAVAPREDHTGDHERHTVVLWSSSDGRCFEPVVCMKAKSREGKLLRDIDLKRVPKGIAVQFSPKGSYDEEATLAMFRNKFPVMSASHLVSPTKGWRGLLMDQMDGQLTPECIRLCLERRRIPSIIWGCLTGMTQPADKRQNQTWKGVAEEEESDMVSTKMEKHPGTAAKLTRQELLERSARTAARVKKDGLHLKMAREFPRSGINLPLDGKHDEVLLDPSLKPYWYDSRICGERSIPEWRKQYLADTIATTKAKEMKQEKRFRGPS